MVQLKVTMTCNQTPRASNQCVFCTNYLTEGWTGIDWVKIDGPHADSHTVDCGYSDVFQSLTNFKGTIAPGSYRARGWLYYGSCLDPNKTQEYYDSGEYFSVTY
jgi:hypothetical protein